MKRMKRIASFMLAAVFVLAMSMPVAAAGNHNLTIESKTSGHTFEAYQVFKGDYSADKDNLSNIDWGNGVDGDALLAALKEGENSPYRDCEDAEDVAEIIKGLADNSTGLDAFAKIVSDHLTKDTANIKRSGDPSGSEGNYRYVISGLEDGYYFVKDQDDSLDGSTAAYTKFILGITNDETVVAKTDTPSAVKKVKENTKYTIDGGYGVGYNDVADYNIGDDVPFLFDSKVPDMSNYTTYKYAFHDELSAGLTLKADTISVKIGGATLTKGTDYTLDVSGNKFDITIADLKKIAAATKDAPIVVEYTATLNSSAVIGGNGNTNKMQLEYSNNPNDTGSTTTTPWDTVVVFTYELDTTKVDGGDTATKLQDAEFKLHNSDGKWAVVDDNGKLTGWADAEDDGSTLTSDSDGLFKVIGLDAGTYYLKEEKAPEGYNTLSKEIEIIVTADTNHIQDWAGTDVNQVLKALKVTYGEAGSTQEKESGSGDATTGIVDVTVANNQGTVLPSTGGIGTTIFYIIGGVLVVGAAIMLLSKKFAGNEK